MRPLRRLWDEFESAKAGLPLAKTSTTENQPGTDRRPPSTAISVKGPAMSFVEWLPHFYDEILLVLEQELKWYVKLPFELTWSLEARASGSLLLRQRCAILQPCFIS
jgi:hypothetical protein